MYKSGQAGLSFCGHVRWDDGFAFALLGMEGCFAGFCGWGSSFISVVDGSRMCVGVTGTYM